MRVTGLLDEGLLDERAGRAHPTRPSPPAALACAVLVWACAAAAFFATYRADAPLPDELVAGRYVFELLEDAQEGPYGFSAPAVVFAGDASFKVRVLYDGERFMARERFEAYAVFEDFAEQNDLRLSQKGLVADASVTTSPAPVHSGALAPLVELRAWASNLFDDEKSRGSALLRALVTGDREALDREGLYDDMKAVGLAHMVAVSGSHLSVVGAMAGSLMRRIGVRACVAAVVLCAFYAAYSVFTGLTAPVMRACVMSSIAACAPFARRRSSALAALSVCVCVLIGLDPYNALSLSFFLSAASTFGVAVFGPLFSSWAMRASGGRFPAACDALALTLAAGLPIAPVTAAVFSRVSFVSPLANFAAAPVFSALLACGLAALALSAALPAAGQAVVAALTLCSEGFCRAAEVLAGLPFASVPVTGSLAAVGAVAAVASISLWAWWPKPAAQTLRVACAVAVAACAACTVVLPRLADEDEVVMLDVGQGDALLIRSQGRALLVDTGNQEQKLMAALARQGVASVDGVVVTHHDDDHCGCLELLAPNIAGGVLVSRPTLSCGCDGCRDLCAAAVDTVGEDRIAALSAGDAIQVGRFACTAVWPYEFAEEGGNADSLCLLVEYDAEGDGRVESSVLLTGDAEADEIRAMMDEAGIESVDVVKAGHHGSKAGVDDGLTERIGADAVLVSAGANNRYGHPSAEALAEFEGAGARVFRTDEQGDVTCRFEGGSIAFSTQR